MTETEEDQIPEEIIKTDSTEKEPENVTGTGSRTSKTRRKILLLINRPETSKVNENQEEKEDFGKTMKLPELKNS